MSVNHEVMVKGLGGNRAAIYLDGRELDGVISYKIERDTEALQRVTFTIWAEKVLVS